MSINKRWEVEARARQWEANPNVWAAWEVQFFFSAKRIRLQHFLTNPRIGKWLARNDEQFNHSSLAIASNLCIILTALVLLLSIAIFA